MSHNQKPVNNSDAEKRVHSRMECEIIAEICIIDYESRSSSIADLYHEKLHFRIHNVSMGGLFLESPPPLKKGEILRVQAELPGTTAPLQAFGEVCWTNSEGGGLRFLAMAEQSLEALKSYIHNAAPGIA